MCVCKCVSELVEEWWVWHNICFYLHDKALTLIGLPLGVCVDAAGLLLERGGGAKARRKEGGGVCVCVEGREEQLLAPATGTKQHGRSHE